MDIDLKWPELYPACLCYDKISLDKTLHENDFVDLCSPDNEAFNNFVESHSGVWTKGWHWSNSEPGGGGLVKAYCCTDHSGQSIETFLLALDDWQAALVELAALFKEFMEKDVSSKDVISNALHSLLSFVANRTECNDAWYGTFETCVTWMFQACQREDLVGILAADLQVSNALYDFVCSSGFKSWVYPSEKLRRSTVNELSSKAVIWIQSR